MPMSAFDRGRLTIVACESGKVFAERVSAALGRITLKESGMPFRGLADASEIFFSNGEVKTMINESVRGDDVYIIQCVDDPTSDRSINDNLMALFTALDAAKQADADRITAVVPQFPYSRQERKKGREGVTARQIAHFLEGSGATRVISLDIHADAIGGFFNDAILDDLHASTDLIEAFRQRVLKGAPANSVTVVSPDVGSAEKARYYSRALGCDMAIGDKERDYSQPNTVVTMRLVGEVKGKDVLLVDDIIDTGGSIVEAMATCKRQGAKDIYLAVTHPFLTGKAIPRLNAAYEEGMFKRMFGTDAVTRSLEWQAEHPWYSEVTVAPLFAKVIYNINRKRSVSSLLS